MPHAKPRDPIYRGRRFTPETIEQCVRWYITYRLSYRDLAAMMAEQGVSVTHTTIMRWVLRYVPEYQARWARFARARFGTEARPRHHYGLLRHGRRRNAQHTEQ